MALGCPADGSETAATSMAGGSSSTATTGGDGPTTAGGGTSVSTTGDAVTTSIGSTAGGGGTSSGMATTTSAATTADTGGRTSNGGGGGGDGDDTDTDTDTDTGVEQPFRPCPDTGPCRVLPLGDSITFGLGVDGGYRVELFRLALAGGHDITFTGTQQANGPAMVDGVPFPRGHEGISGERIDQIANRVPAPALDDPPHIILLHAGTNDIIQQQVNAAPERLAALVDELLADAPDALLVVSTVIPLQFNPGGVAQFNPTVEPLARGRAETGAHIIFVDQFDGFPNGELADGVHPNQAGYDRMGQVWFDAIEPYLP